MRIQSISGVSNNMKRQPNNDFNNQKKKKDSQKEDRNEQLRKEFNNRNIGSNQTIIDNYTKLIIEAQRSFDKKAQRKQLNDS